MPQNLRVSTELKASKSAGAKGDVPKISGFVHPLHPRLRIPWNNTSISIEIISTYITMFRLASHFWKVFLVCLSWKQDVTGIWLIFNIRIGWSLKPTGSFLVGCIDLQSILKELYFQEVVVKYQKISPKFCVHWSPVT